MGKMHRLKTGLYIVDVAYHGALFVALLTPWAGMYTLAALPVFSCLSYFHGLKVNMNRGKTRCHWCSNLYTSPGAYSTHLKKVHTEMNFKGTGKRKRRFSDISNLSTSGSELDPDLDKPGSLGRYSNQNSITSPPHLDLKTLRVIVSQDYGSSDIEYESDRSDREARSFTSNPEPNGDGQPSDWLDLRPRAGIAIRKYFFPEENESFNL